MAAIQLVRGWNLIGSGLDATITDVNDVLQSSIYRFSQVGYSITTISEDSTITSIRYNAGYFVHGGLWWCL
jgi:hypothetical protein